MAPAPPPPPAWSVTVCLRHRGGLELRAAAENVLPGWGHGGERLSLLVRLRRSLRLAVTSQFGRAAAADPKNPRAGKILRFIRSKWARVPSVWRRKSPPAARASIAAAKPGSRSQSRASAPPAYRYMLTWTARKTKAAAALCLFVVLAVAVFRGMGGQWRGGYYEPVAHSTSWRRFVARKLAKFLDLEPRLYEWLLKLGLKRLLNW